VSSKVRMEIAPPFWSAIYTIPTVWHYKYGLQIIVQKSPTGSALIYQEGQKNRSTEGQLPALKRATASIMQKNRSPEIRESVHIECTALHSQEAMRRCPILMGSSETDDLAFREVQAEACPHEKHKEVFSCIKKFRD